MATAVALSRTRSALETLLIAVVYFLAAKVSLLMAIPPGYATPVWPPSGIALAALLLFGNRVWVGVWLGAALINVTVQGSPFIAGAIATGNTLEAIAAATLVRPVMGRHWRFQTGEDVVRFIVSCALCAGIAAAVGVGTLEISGAIDSSAAVANALTWWQGDASGMIIVAPLLLSWSTPLVVRWPTAKIVEGVLLVLLLAMTTVVIFGGTGSDWTSVTLAFLALPFVVWAAVRFSQREVTTAVAIVCAIADWYAVRGHYPFGADSPVAARRRSYAGARNAQSRAARGNRRARRARGGAAAERRALPPPGRRRQGLRALQARSCRQRHYQEPSFAGEEGSNGRVH